MSTQAEIPFQQLLDALLDVDTPLPPRLIYRLSDLESNELEQFKPVWRQLPLWRRQALMQDIEELCGTDFLLDFSDLARFTLEDSDPRVRLLAVQTLWEYERRDSIPLFLDLLDNEADPLVRAAAAGALGTYVYAGEIEEIPQEQLRNIEEVLLSIVNGNDDARVRRAALEALGFSSRKEVQPLIQKAFETEDSKWKASALNAMGRSANRFWQPQVMSMLESSLPLLRGEAARAAGELEISDAAPFLLEMLDDPDEEARAASIWSLSQIGGEGVREALEILYEEAEDEDELDLLEAALENLAFTEGVKFMPLFDFPDSMESETEEDDWYEGLDDMDDLFDDEEGSSD